MDSFLHVSLALVSVLSLMACQTQEPNAILRRDAANSCSEASCADTGMHQDAAIAEDALRRRDGVMLEEVGAVPDMLMDVHRPLSDGGVPDTGGSSPCFVNVRTEGAKGDGIADDTAAIERAMSKNVPVFFPPGVYRITDELAITNAMRNVHFIGSNRLDCLVSSRIDDGCVRSSGRSTIVYDGKVGDDLAVVRVAAVKVGVRAQGIDESVLSFRIRNLRLDANKKAGYGLYMTRVAPPTIVSNVILTGARRDGLYASQQYYGIYEHLIAHHNGRNGIAIGRGSDDFGWKGTYVNNTTWRDILAYGNGAYGISARLHRANMLMLHKLISNGQKGLHYTPASGPTVSVPNELDAKDPLSGAVFVQYAIQGAVSAKAFGAKGDGVTDDTKAIQKALTQGRPVCLPPGTYRITDELTVAGKADVTIFGTGTSWWPNSTQVGGPSWAHGGTYSTLVYQGAVDDRRSMIRVSTAPTGTEPTTSVFGRFQLRNIGLDGQNRIAYGIYIANANNPHVDGVSVRGTRRDAIYVAQQDSGLFEHLALMRNYGSGISFGRAYRDYHWKTPYVDNTTLRNIAVYASGKDGAFQEAKNAFHGYGIGLWMNNGNTMLGASSEDNDGLNFLVGRSRLGNRWMNMYSELASKYTEPKGGSALATKRTTRRYALWLNDIRDIEVENVFIHGTGTTAEWIRIGRSPSVGKVLLKGFYFGAGAIGDWTGVTFVDVYKALVGK